MAALTPYFFALDHTHYSRWVPVSLYDLENLKHINPEEYGQIEQFFTVSKTRNRYSAMAIDQAHEQNNGRIKNIKGALAFLGTNTKERPKECDKINEREPNCNDTIRFVIFQCMPMPIVSV